MESGKSYASIEDFNIQSQVPQANYGDDVTLLLTLSHDKLFGILVMEDVNRSFTLIVLPGKRNRKGDQGPDAAKEQKRRKEKKRKVSSGGALCYVELPEFGESNEGFGTLSQDKLFCILIMEDAKRSFTLIVLAGKRNRRGDQGPDTADKEQKRQ